jgi:hypothetical protein
VRKYIISTKRAITLQITILQMFASDMETYGRLVQTKVSLPILQTLPHIAAFRNGQTVFTIHDIPETVYAVLCNRNLANGLSEANREKKKLMEAGRN